MGYETERYNLEQSGGYGLWICTCGWQQCHGGHECGLGVRDHFALHCVVKGRGTYRTRGLEARVCEGGGFLIWPGERISYQADEKEPWEYYFITFKGQDAPAVLRTAGLGPEDLTFRFDQDNRFETHIKNAYECGSSAAKGGLDVLGHFYLALSRLASHQNKTAPAHPMREEYLRSAMQFIINNHPYRISIADIARYVGIDRTYLFRIFKSETGMSPQKWLLAYRLRCARQYMRKSDLTLTEIAYSTGFLDLAHFSRAYKQQYGVAPKAHRLSEK